MRKYLVIFAISLLATVFAFTITITQPQLFVALNKSREIKLVSFTQLSTPQVSSSSVESPLIPDTSFTEQNGNTSILNLLRDSIWQFIGALLAIITIVISVIIFFLQKSNKLLTYEILSETALLSVAKEVEDKVRILFEGNVVQGVHLILIQISNTGNVPILPSDFLKDLTISFDGGAKILSAEITDKKPHAIDTNITISGTQLIISPSLWNGGDKITVKSLVSEFNGSVQISGRIVGIQDIKCSKPGAFDSNTSVVILLGMLLILVGIGLSAFTRRDFFLLALIGYVLWLLPVIYDKKYRKIVFTVLRNGM